MDAYADGDDAVFSGLYAELAPRLHAYVRRLARLDAVAHDIVQQTFLNVHQARDRFARGSRVETWVFSIAHRLTVDWARAERRRADLASAGTLVSDRPGPEVEAHNAELLGVLGNELASVPSKLREAFLLVHVRGFSMAEAGAALGTSAVAARVRAHRASLMLRPGLAKFRRRGDLE
jgi:RNA polymerase sigma-70 factor, ECF subfamily